MQPNPVFAPRRAGADTSAAQPPVKAQSVAPTSAASPQPGKTDGIDPQVIKKMLRHNDQERTPFQ